MVHPRRAASHGPSPQLLTGISAALGALGAALVFVLTAMGLVSVRVARRVGHAGCWHDALRAERRRRAGHNIKAAHVEAGLDEVRGHVPAHGAEADEADRAV